MNTAISLWKQRGKRLQDIYAVFLAIKHPRVDWRAKVVAGLVLGYALLPIDVLPESIPFVGVVDDLVVVTLGLTAAMKLIPDTVLAECLAKSEAAAGKLKLVTWGLIGLAALWLGLIVASVVLLYHAMAAA